MTDPQLVPLHELGILVLQFLESNGWNKSAMAFKRYVLGVRETWAIDERERERESRMRRVEKVVKADDLPCYSYHGTMRYIIS